MKKIYKIIIVILIIILAITTIYYFTSNEKDALRGTSWFRVTDVDTEYINFHKDGTFSYYYGVGSPVGDTDLCSTYEYSESTKVIKLDCGKYDVIDEIKVKSKEDTKLIIIFDNEEIIFSLVK